MQQPPGSYSAHYLPNCKAIWQDRAELWCFSNFFPPAFQVVRFSGSSDLLLR